MYQTEHDRAVSECFDPHNGGERDCDNCVACPDNGGGCCFGEKHQYGDKECQECIHEAECASIVHGHHRQPAPRERSSRVLLRRGAVTQKGNKRLVVVNNRQRGDKKQLLADKPNRTPAKRQQEAEETEEQAPPTFVERLGKHVGWGMAEGGLQMALDFFTRNRPED